MILFDTPGIMREQRSRLDERMMAAVVTSIKAAEAIVAVVDAGERGVCVSYRGCWLPVQLPCRLSEYEQPDLSLNLSSQTSAVVISFSHLVFTYRVHSR